MLASLSCRTSVIYSYNISIGWSYMHMCVLLVCLMTACFMLMVRPCHLSAGLSRRSHACRLVAIPCLKNCISHASVMMHTLHLLHVSTASRPQRTASYQPKHKALTQMHCTQCQYNMATYLCAVCVTCTSEVNACDIHPSQACMSLAVYSLLSYL